MTDSQITQAKEDVYTATFQMLDADPDLTGEQAGAVATATADAFETALRLAFEEEAGQYIAAVFGAELRHATNWALDRIEKGGQK